MRIEKFTLFVFAAFAALFASGCVEKTLYPAVMVLVEDIDPDEVAYTEGATELPKVTLTLTPQNGVPSSLVSYRISYFTRLSESIPELRVEETAFDLYLPANTQTAVTIPVYTTRVVDLFSLSQSDIAPIKAVITLTIKDVNGNTIQKDAHCNLSAPTASGS